MQATDQTTRASEQNSATDDNTSNSLSLSQNSTELNKEIKQNEDVSFINNDQWTFVNDATVDSVLQNTDSESSDSDTSGYDSDTATKKKKKKKTQKRVCKRQRLATQAERKKKGNKRLPMTLLILKKTTRTCCPH